MLFSLNTRKVVLENPSTGSRDSVFLEFGHDGTLAITDADSDIPQFVHRVSINDFPSDEVILKLVSDALGGPRVLSSAPTNSIELDFQALLGLKKMPVDIFDNVYLDEVKEKALILCVDVRNFSDFLRDNREETVFKLIKDFNSNFLSCVNQFGVACSYYKLMGDGALIIWDDTDALSVSEALQVFDMYTDFVNEELFKHYEGLGFAGTLVTEKVFKYEISAEAPRISATGSLLSKLIAALRPMAHIHMLPAA